jgi:hypothetical protein
MTDRHADLTLRTERLGPLPVINHVFVGHSAGFVVDREHVVRLIAQPASDSRTRAFVDKESHLRWLGHKWEEGCARHGSRCKQQTCLDIFSPEALVFVQDGVNCRAVTQQIQYVIHGQPCAFDHGLPNHDLRITTDSFKELLIGHLFPLPAT